MHIMNYYKLCGFGIWVGGEIPAFAGMTGSCVGMTGFVDCRATLSKTGRVLARLR